MLQTEYVRNLHCNYERLLLNQKPEDKRYQYCILSRGGIKGLLPCSLRYIDGQAYLYYDISSKQNIAQIFERRCITRDWICDFMWSYRQIQQELDRFLLDDHNVIWHPEQIFADLDNRIFSFMYIPYCEYENSFGKLVDFWVEHIDYEDETLVEFVYHVYDQLEKNGDIYLQGQIFEDAVLLERKEVKKTETIDNLGTEGMEQELQQPPTAEEQLVTTKEEKKKFFSIFEGKKRKNKDIQENYRKEMQREMNGYAVAEEETYTYGKTIDDDQETEYGRTVYIEERPDSDNMEHRLYSPEGKLLASLSKEIFCIGKKKEEVDLVLEDISVSRMHARIMKQGTEIYLEDLNSTNGTYKNGLRLEPYERRKLESEDEIKCGNIILIFR
ncbi:MAG: FHA domain-containing protein [Lachnospiraceae bacterium]|nr:FHA domain-containing protein [Lachnospiraceae bacterium]MCI9676849.1 FHA domain-containing protein [Lachnospiraceae bacterium]